MPKKRVIAHISRTQQPRPQPVLTNTIWTALACHPHTRSSYHTHHRAVSSAPPPLPRGCLFSGQGRAGSGAHSSRRPETESGGIGGPIAALFCRRRAACPLSRPAPVPEQRTLCPALPITLSSAPLHFSSVPIPCRCCPAPSAALPRSMSWCHLPWSLQISACRAGHA